MKYETKFKESSNDRQNKMVEIIYNGKVFGEWNNEANCDYPEDLIIGRDLNDLIDIGIEIGRQMERDAK